MGNWRLIAIFVCKWVTAVTVLLLVVGLALGALQILPALFMLPVLPGSAWAMLAVLEAVHRWPRPLSVQARLTLGVFALGVMALLVALNLDFFWLHDLRRAIWYGPFALLLGVGFAWMNARLTPPASEQQRAAERAARHSVLRGLGWFPPSVMLMSSVDNFSHARYLRGGAMLWVALTMGWYVLTRRKRAPRAAP